jgi:hypothetical protein
MKKYFGLLAGGLAMIAFQSTASAAFIECGGVGSGSGNTVFGSGSTVGSVLVSGGTATITCPSFTLPALNSLVSVDLNLHDDAQSPANSTSAVQWTWTQTSATPSGVTGNGAIETSTASGSTFTGCVTTGVGNLPVCDATATFADPVAAGGTVNSIVFTVSAAAINGGVSSIGSDSASLYIQFDEAAPAPEPATLTLVGGSLIGLGLIARKRRKKA